MNLITLKQSMGDHRFQVIENGEITDHCDLIAAEEIAACFEERNYTIVWLYPEDEVGRKYNA